MSPRRSELAPHVGNAEPSPPPTKPEIKVVAANQTRLIDEAIARGVSFLEEEQNKDGSWFSQVHHLGTTSLPALTLLECGVPANDPRIKKAADYVRKHWSVELSIDRLEQELLEVIASR